MAYRRLVITSCIHIATLIYNNQSTHVILLPICTLVSPRHTGALRDPTSRDDLAVLWRQHIPRSTQWRPVLTLPPQA